jgi:hypothetical protein
VHKYIANVVLISTLILTGSALAQYTRMSNQTIRAMVHGGVPVEIITQAIKTAPQISLDSNKQEFIELLNVGASVHDANEIMKAIEERGANGVAGVTSPAAVAPVVTHRAVEPASFEPRPASVAPVQTVAASVQSPTPVPAATLVPA